jgi:prephenate dehydrogenase
MGRLMDRLFREAGCSVVLADALSGPIQWELLGKNDVIVLAVPISAVDQVVRAVGPHTREDGLVVDVASLKEAPVRSMLENCRGDVIGSHPLFGPHVTSLQGQLVFTCSARSDRWGNWFREVWENQGAVVEEIDPAAHDRLMGTVQVLRHALVFCFGRTLMRLGFDPAAELHHSGPWFSQLVAMLRNQLDEHAALYPELAFPNESTDMVLSVLNQSVDEICATYQARDREGLIRMIDDLKAAMVCSPRSEDDKPD